MGGDDGCDIWGRADANDYNNSSAVISLIDIPESSKVVVTRSDEMEEEREEGSKKPRERDELTGGDP